MGKTESIRKPIMKVKLRGDGPLISPEIMIMSNLSPSSSSLRPHRIGGSPWLSCPSSWYSCFPACPTTQAQGFPAVCEATDVDRGRPESHSHWSTPRVSLDCSECLRHCQKYSNSHLWFSEEKQQRKTRAAIRTYAPDSRLEPNL